MRIIINRDYISKKTTYQGQNNPKYIVIHETDNFAAGAGAKRHAQAQYNGNLNTSVHYYCGSDGIYQAADHSDGTKSIGVEYGGNHAITDATNRNTINIEICVNSDGDYTVARKNAIELVKYLMQTTGIPAERVIRHYDAKGKYCPRKMMDNPALWEDFKKQIGQTVAAEPEKDVKPENNKWYRVGTGWANGFCQGQIGAFLILDNAKNACKAGYNVYDESGNVIYNGGQGQTAQAAQTTSAKADKYPPGVYTLTANMNVRTGPGTKYRIKTKSELTADGQKHSTSAGTLFKGTKVTVSIVTEENENYWATIPSGCIALEYNDNVYAMQ